MSTEQPTSWKAPTLVKYGSVEELTRTDKTWGGDDGMTLEGAPIQNNYS